MFFENNAKKPVDISTLAVVPTVLVLGTGGTIAGTATDANDVLGYTAGQIGVAQLLLGVPGLALLPVRLQIEQLAQVDSKDMDFELWKALALRVHAALQQADLAAVVITHGTDTLEETAYFLHAVLPCDLLAQKPVVLTCAMRPASAPAPDGPQNLLDAVTTALDAAARGVLVVCTGQIHGALAVQKMHTSRVDAFSSGDAGPVGSLLADPHAAAGRATGAVRVVWHQMPPVGASGADLMALLASANALPRVELVVSHAGAGPLVVEALLASLTSHVTTANAGSAAETDRLRGLVVAGTGNGTVHKGLEAALVRAQQAGVHVVRASRCAWGGVQAVPGRALAAVSTLSAVKARVALQLELLAF